ncbi:unnamed protein product [Brassicogethes aeneus]|uniref:Glycoprotein-N-acetylgalactosamine 3-beta-galactosyltransferase 1 n=1 Tax=Brassicogethes aeneus TaxID=1431903 RepID=A0A9P0BMY7_BRAAE|nr:unnamed protein product [Brassicogethes aeneus]
MLLDKNPENPIYFGCHFKKHVKQGYMSGGAGYVLSRQALKQFIENGLKKTTHCHPGLKGDEDVELGRCLEAAQVKVGDSRDSQKRGRYFGGMEGISDYAVSFHHVEVVDMYFFEYLIYHLRPFGIYDIPQNVSYYLN